MMRASRLVCFILSLMLVPLSARAEEISDAVYIVTYVEVSVPAVKHAADVLRQIAEKGRQAPGIVRFDVLQRTGPENEFAVVEVWKNLQVRNEDAAKGLAGPLRAELDGLLIAPLDQRLCAIVTASGHVAASAGLVYAISHIDILGPNPAGRDAFMPVLAAFIDASRKAPGNLGYDLGQQSSRTNHFETVEVWSNPESANAHDSSELNRSFRAKLGPGSSSPYDRRWYKALQ
jgi:quinol monooxygenase YgiN